MAAITERTNVFDQTDALHDHLTAVRAITDAAKVLTALERARAEPTGGTLATGEGYADGHVLRDATLPALLAHATRLLDQAEGIVASLPSVTA